ncbi:hypothetical protein EVAR_8594_1 [Eumeta japonica]|uniref:Uncharacterized protein n=1 Tax=Eumeta variegata TaxID=151549 RepID=A0A4C1XFR2_EUMVA|nr:hypothetical protein EVAR_8594_1 [Eumeta japonica]
MDDKIDDVCELMKDTRLDILCENGTKRKSNGGAIKRGSFDTYWAGLDQSQPGWRSVGFILSERLSECVNGYECVIPRLLWLRPKIGQTWIFILGVYAPDMFKPLEKREEFWADLKDILELKAWLDSESRRPTGLERCRDRSRRCDRPTQNDEVTQSVSTRTEPQARANRKYHTIDAEVLEVRGRRNNVVTLKVERSFKNSPSPFISVWTHYLFYGQPAYPVIDDFYILNLRNTIVNRLGNAGSWQRRARPRRSVPRY